MRQIFEDAPESWNNLGSLNADNRAIFESAQAVITIGHADLQFTFPANTQPADEGWEYTHTTGDLEGVTVYYQPVMIGQERTWEAEDASTVTGWAIVPGLLRLAMADLEVLETIILQPLEPTVTNYRDTIRWNPSDPFSSPNDLGFSVDFSRRARIGDGLRQSGQVPWGQISDTQGWLFGICNVGRWAICRLSDSNQVLAYNLETEEYHREQGFTGVPTGVLSMPATYDPLEPWDGFDFGTTPWTIHIFDVLGPIGNNRVLVLKESHVRQVETIGAFGRGLTPPVEVTVPSYALEESGYTQPGQTATVSDLFFGKWINANIDSAPVIDPPEEPGIYRPYKGVTSTFQCGLVGGEPWIGGGFLALAASVPARTEATVRSQFSAALIADAVALAYTPEFRAIRVPTASYKYEIWEFPDEGEPSVVLEDTLGTIPNWSPGEVYGGPSAVFHSTTSVAELALILADPEVYPENTSGNWLIPPLGAPGVPLPGWDADSYPDPENYHEISEYRWSSNRSPLESGSDGRNYGTFQCLHQTSPVSTLNEEGRPYYAVVSQDVNNCPGPAGPWMQGTKTGSGEDTVYSPPTDENFGQMIMTRVGKRIEAAIWHKIPTPWHSGKYVTDGDVLIFLPRERTTVIRHAAEPSNPTSEEIRDLHRVRCLPLAEGQPDWTVYTYDHVEPLDDNTAAQRPVESTGCCVSNGVLTSTFLYCVVLGGGGVGGAAVYKLLKIRVRASDDGSAGDVVAEVSLPQAVSFSDEVWRDNLVVVNRRCVGVGFTQFFEIINV